MPANEGLIEIVREWAEKAEDDLFAASHLLKAAQEAPRGVICLHAQQCIEKYLKALLVWERIEFPKTHNIELLRSLAPERLQSVLAIEDPARMSDFAVTTRYPGTYEPISLAEARKAVASARRIRREVRRLLPRQVKTSKKK